MGQQSVFHSQFALTPHGWMRNVRVSVDNGQITAIDTDVDSPGGAELSAVLLPGMSNVHSHAFQRGMAGLAEMGGPAADNFWSWRTAMYRFALEMNPDDVETVAAQLYVEMLEAGFCRVGEFHYLHHDRDGTPYANIAEMAERIAAAANHSGIGLTLLPVFYAHSGFGGTPPMDHQRRFICDINSFAKLLDGCRHAVKPLQTANIGIAPHSLRAVTPAELAQLVAMAPDGPIHIHAAEQTLEIEDCLAWSGARPVEWLLDHAELGPRWCLIHATHMNGTEIRRLAQSGAVAGLCPITEANLGDGIFPTQDFLHLGGHFGIGSDSNILIGIPDELRQLEYAQRLKLRARNVLAGDRQSSGKILFENALKGGGIALNYPAGLAVGYPADMISLDTSQVQQARGDAICDAWLFTKSVRVDSVWVGGRKLVSNGQHIHRSEIAARFKKTMRMLT